MRYKLEIATFRHYAKRGDKLFIPHTTGGHKCLPHKSNCHSLDRYQFFLFLYTFFIML